MLSLTVVRVPQTDPIITGFLYEAFAYIAKPTKEQTLGDLLGLALKCGEVNIRAMELLNQGHIGLYGKPVPTRVRVCLPVCVLCCCVPADASLGYWCGAMFTKLCVLFVSALLLPSHSSRQVDSVSLVRTCCN